jgi:hypothetical protein
MMCVQVSSVHGLSQYCEEWKIIIVAESRKNDTHQISCVDDAREILAVSIWIFFMCLVIFARDLLFSLSYSKNEAEKIAIFLVFLRTLSAF